MIIIKYNSKRKMKGARNVQRYYKWIKQLKHDDFDMFPTLSVTLHFEGDFWEDISLYDRTFIMDLSGLMQQQSRPVPFWFGEYSYSSVRNYEDGKTDSLTLYLNFDIANFKPFLDDKRRFNYLKKEYLICLENLRDMYRYHGR